MLPFGSADHHLSICLGSHVARFCQLVIAGVLALAPSGNTEKPLLIRARAASSLDNAGTPSARACVGFTTGLPSAWAAPWCKPFAYSGVSSTTSPAGNCRLFSVSEGQE